MAIDTVADALWLSVVSGLVFLSWGYHLYRAGKLWWAERSFRSFRNFWIAVMLQLGMLRIWIGATARVDPSQQDVFTQLQEVVAPILTLMLLTGGLVVAYTWRRS